MRVEQKIIITMNPDQLRKLADKMEEDYFKAKLGGTTFVDFLGYSDRLQVCLHFDQVWFEKNRSEALPEKHDPLELCFDMKDIIESKWSHKIRTAYDQAIEKGIKVIHMPTRKSATCDDFKSANVNRHIALVRLDKRLRREIICNT